MWCVDTHTHTNTQEYIQTIKENNIIPFAAIWMDLEMIILSEVRQEKINIVWYYLFMESKKKTDRDGYNYKTEIDSQA